MGTPQSVARIYFCRLDKYPPVLAAGSWVGGRCCERQSRRFVCMYVQPNQPIFSHLTPTHSIYTTHPNEWFNPYEKSGLVSGGGVLREGRCRSGNCLIRFTAWRSGCGHVMRIVHVQNWSRESLMNDRRVYGRIWIYRNERLDVGVWPAFWERVDAAVEIALLDSLKRCGHVISTKLIMWIVNEWPGVYGRIRTYGNEVETSGLILGVWPELS